MSEKKIRARKDHICDYCQKIIKKGELYVLGKGKQGKYADEECVEQIGIEYWLYRTHINCEILENQNEN